MSGFVGATTYYNDAVAATKQVVKAAAAHVHSIHLINTTGSTAFLQVFNKLTADVTVGSTTPDFAIRLPANGVFTLPLPVPLAFSTGIVIAGTTTAGGSSGAAISVLLAVT